MTWILNNLPLLWQRLLEHLTLAAPAIVLSLLLAIPLGWIAYRYRLSRWLLVTLTGLLYAIPSLPLFVVLPLILGTGIRDSINVVAALTLYGLALMVRSVSDALAAVPAVVVDAAQAQGFGAWRRFWQVELPLAIPALTAGLRVVTVSTVSLVTVSGVLGLPSLGLLFTDGFQRGIPEEILAGMVLTVVLALVLDALVALLGRALTPWRRAVKA
ncbi:ABC transporter permease [Galactobacter caseinivorans]|uniref:ABC transporter permease subunit n=1 Tax=Galactobacter caseinivorans TaxID=2676123 RepID=A0A496PFD3_9MICC|nr:ABC transporter permease subunit [Galactobacter caseinivorans]RKW69429.1 ABC transporter permease subunit [Galactobacter caseinivorans]